VLASGVASVHAPHIELHRGKRVELNEDLTLHTEPTETGVRLTLSSDATGGAVEFVVQFTESGPVVGVRAAKVQLETQEWTTQCDRYSVHARESITMTSDGTIDQRSTDATRMEARSVTIDTTPGAIRLRANDDVQLLGEQVLLNCERKPPMPRWVPESREQMASLPAATTSGDPDVIAEMLGNAK